MATGNGVFSRLFGLGKNNGEGKISDCCGGVAIIPEEQSTEEGSEASADTQAAKTADTTTDLLIITGNCCNPGIKPLDDEATRVAEEVATETEPPVQVRTMSATAVLNGALSREVVENLDALQRQGRLQLPALMINGEYVTGGRIDREDIESALGIGPQAVDGRRP